MGVPFVQSNQVVNVNSEDFAFPANPNGIPLQIPCENTQIIATYWRIPQVQGGRVTGYQYIVANNTSIKPQPDALKVLQVKLTDTAGITEVMFAVLDSDNVVTSSPINEFAYLCDGSGGTLPVMPTVVIPIPMLQNGPQTTDTDGTNHFVFPFPANPNALNYNIQGEWINSVAATPTFNPTGITTVAGVASWLNSNQSAYGTWSSTGDILKLSSPTSAGEQALTAGFLVTLTAKPFCFDLTAFSSPASVNQVQFGSGNIISVPAFLLTNNPVTLMNVLIPVMSSQTIFDPTSVAHKLTVTTVQATPKLLFNGTTVATAGAGACS